MGYTIRIGQRAGNTVKRERHESAPADGVPTDYTNERWPSYGGWSDFCDATGLNEVMTELMPEHPGVAPIQPRHLDAIKEAAKRNMAAYNRARLEWLSYWVEWALKNCKSPACYNH